MHLIEAFEELNGYFSDFPDTKNSWIPMIKNTKNTNTGLEYVIACTSTPESYDKAFYSIDCNGCIALTDITGASAISDLQSAENAAKLLANTYRWAYILSVGENSELKYIKNMSETLQEAFTDRNTLINNIKSTGRRYNFDKWSDTQLYRMWQRIQQEEHNKKIARKILDDRKKADSIKYCPECGLQLSDNGKCHRCDADFGFEDLDEGIFDGSPNTSNWVSMSTGNKVNTSTSNSTYNTTSSKPYYVVSASANVNIKDSLFY